MLNTVDRILVAVHSLDEAEKNYTDVLAARAAGEFDSAFLNARVRRLTVGSSEVELCQPVGEGAVRAHLEQFGEGLVFGGVTVGDIAACERQLEANAVGFVRADDRLYLDSSSLHGLPLVVSATGSTPRNRVPGPIEFLYELTMVLRSPWQEVASRYAAGLGLDPARMVDISFPRFGYDGTLMMFDPDRLDRIELSEAHDPAFAMGRFSARRGDALYMCYAQTDDLQGVIDRLEGRSARWTRRTQTPRERDGLWIHPSALNGVLMGVSRHSLAWQWSGRPERVEALQEVSE